MKLLALSGSLRAASINSALLRAAARLAPSGIEVEVFGAMGELSLFNPDRESDPPLPVVRLRRAVDAADALLIASPEYAHGVSGVMKNALDWLVSFAPFAGKPVAVINASPRAAHADTALKETLRTMSAVLVDEACVAIPLLGAGLDEQGMVDAEAVAAPIQRALEALCREAARRRPLDDATFPLG